MLNVKPGPDQLGDELDLIRTRTSGFMNKAAAGEKRVLLQNIRDPLGSIYDIRTDYVTDDVRESPIRIIHCFLLSDWNQDGSEPRPGSEPRMWN